MSHAWSRWKVELEFEVVTSKVMEEMNDSQSYEHAETAALVAYGCNFLGAVESRQIKSVQCPDRRV